MMVWILLMMFLIIIFQAMTISEIIKIRRVLLSIADRSSALGPSGS